MCSRETQDSTSVLEAVQFKLTSVCFERVKWRTLIGDCRRPGGRWVHASTRMHECARDTKGRPALCPLGRRLLVSGRRQFCVAAWPFFNPAAWRRWPLGSLFPLPLCAAPSLRWRLRRRRWSAVGSSRGTWPPRWRSSISAYQVAAVWRGAASAGHRGRHTCTWMWSGQHTSTPGCLEWD